jgi:hypothetical protein
VLPAEEAKKRGKKRAKKTPADKLGLRLVWVRERRNPKELADLARQLRKLAEALEKPERGGKKKARG